MTLKESKAVEQESFESIQNTKTSTRLLEGDCLKRLGNLDDACVDLIVTSPPYANQRKSTYGGTPADKYVEWFVPIATALQRVLKPTGSFVLNIKENVVNGERSTYVMELIIELRKHGWLFTEEYIWHKKTAMPGKWPNRFRDSWERLIHFTKEKKFNMYQEAVMVPTGDWKNVRLANLSKNDKKRNNSATDSGFGRNMSNWVGRDMSYPTNVLRFAPVCNNKKHSAAFPDDLPEWFIKAFTKEGDTVLDPFAGSGTTLAVSEKLGRNSIGVEALPEYVQQTAKNLGLKKGKNNEYNK